MYFIMPHRNIHTTDPGYFLSYSWSLSLSLPWPHYTHAYVCVHTSPPYIAARLNCLQIPSTGSIVGSHFACGYSWLSCPSARNTFPCLSLSVAIKYSSCTSPFTNHVSLWVPIPSTTALGAHLYTLPITLVYTYLCTTPRFSLPL